MNNHWVLGLVLIFTVPAVGAGAEDAKPALQSQSQSLHAEGRLIAVEDGSVFIAVGLDAEAKAELLEAGFLEVSAATSAKNNTIFENDLYLRYWATEACTKNKRLMQTLIGKSVVLSLLRRPGELLVAERIEAK